MWPRKPRSTRLRDIQTASTQSRFHPMDQASQPPATTNLSSCGIAPPARKFRTLREHVDLDLRARLHAGWQASGLRRRRPLREDLGCFDRHAPLHSFRSHGWRQYRRPFARWLPRSRPNAQVGSTKTIRVWKLGEKEGAIEIENILIAHEDAILKLAWSPDGKYLASASADRTIKLFHADDLSEVRTMANPAGLGVWPRVFSRRKIARGWLV